jgi:hypothetical protein
MSGWWFGSGMRDQLRCHGRSGWIDWKASIITLPVRIFCGTLSLRRRNREQGETLLVPMIFALRAGQDVKVGQTLSGTVYLRLNVADSDGRLHRVSKPLIKLVIDVADISRSSTHFMTKPKRFIPWQNQGTSTIAYISAHGFKLELDCTRDPCVYRKPNPSSHSPRIG